MPRKLRKQKQLKPIKAVTVQAADPGGRQSKLTREVRTRTLALLDFVFNLGEGAYQKSTLRKYVDAEDWNSPATEILKWCHAGGRMVSQLVERRKVESEWLRDG